MTKNEMVLEAKLVAIADRVAAAGEATTYFNISNVSQPVNRWFEAFKGAAGWRYECSYWRDLFNNEVRSRAGVGQ